MTVELADVVAINAWDEKRLQEEFFKCSGSHVWTKEMISSRPFRSAEDLAAKSQGAWQKLSRQDWLDAFKIHPRIGDLDSLRKKYADTAGWASSEQSGVNAASEEIIQGLADGNKRYEDKFGYIFIVCATGKSAAEMLSILSERLVNSPEVEFAIACGEQKKITDIRIGKLQP